MTKQEIELMELAYRISEYLRTHKQSPAEFASEKGVDCKLVTDILSEQLTVTEAEMKGFCKIVGLDYRELSTVPLSWPKFRAALATIDEWLTRSHGKRTSNFIISDDLRRQLDDLPVKDKRRIIAWIRYLLQ